VHPTWARAAGHIRMDVGQRVVQIVPEIRPLAHVKRPKPFAPFKRILVSAAGDDDDIHRRPARTQKMFANRQAVEFRHIDIDHQDIRLEAARLQKGMKAVGNRFDVEAQPRAIIREQPHNRRIVICDENSRPHATRTKLGRTSCRRSHAFDFQD
jgi:hypothetical protein